MNTRDQFGNYLLLKKLTEDPLGESFRAGRGGGQTLDQVVLLRVFNGRGIDGRTLGRTLEARRAVQDALKSPNIGSGVDAGMVGNAPFLAYEYVSGKDLASLMVQAERERSPFPIDHALLITERLAVALAAAHETRFDGERVLHGFVVPQLVMISNEGETRLLGFTAGPALNEQAGTLSPEVQRYLAPEARTRNGGPEKTDDVFSLGALLYELLTATSIPVVPPEGGYESLIQQAQVASEGTPIPGPVAELLRRSLAPDSERLADAPTWHKALSKVMGEGGYSPTIFNLAFFMHNLFRDEIEQESQELEAEKGIAMPAAATVASAGGAETMAIPREEISHSLAEDEAPPPPPEPSGGSKAGLWIGIAALLLLAVGAGAWWFLTQQGDGPDDTELAATAPPPAAVDPAAGPAEAEGPTPEEIQAQIDAMLEEKTKAMEASLRENYDQRIAAMQDELEQAQQAEAQRRRQLEDERRRQAEEAREAPAEPAQEEPTRVAENRPSRPSTPTEGAGSGAASGDSRTERATQPAQQPERQAAATRPEPTVEEKAPAEPPEPKRPSVREGDLVSAGPGVTPPTVVKRAEAQFPPLAARLNKTATVVVQVLVDERGRVTEAKIAGNPPSYGFDEAALEAARASTFDPATKEGVKVKMWTTLRYVFR